MSFPPDDGPECPPGTHSIFDFCPGRSICNEGYYPDCDYEGMYGAHGHIWSGDRWVCDVNLYEVLRDSTGRVTRLDPIELQPRGCSCSVNDPQTLCSYCAEQPGRADCAWGEPFACQNHCPTDRTDEKERGVLSTLKRWARAVSDWLDPHAAHNREARRLAAEWRQQRADLDGGEPGAEGRER